MEIKALKYGESVLPESMCFVNGDKNKFCEIVFKVYLIKTDKKLILVDAGCETMPGFDMKNFIGPIKALRQAGISPDDITDVVITHSHHDHIECVSYFKNAVIHIQKDEYESGKKYIDKSQSINLFDCEYLVCDKVKALKIGGHTKGSCIVEIDCGEKCAIIVGDECYTHRCITEQIPTGCSESYEKSAEFVKKYSGSRYKLLFCHDEIIIGE